MAYIQEFKNDVFVSYAHADNEPDPVGVCWVNQFVRHLEVELRRRLGGTQDLKFYFDKTSLRSNDHLQVLVQNARTSAAFVAIISPSYTARTWTRDELAAFSSSAGEPDRLFALEVLPINEHDGIPEQIAHLHRMKFWWTEPPSDVPYTVTPTAPPDNRYITRLQDLAECLRTQLRGMANAQGERLRSPSIEARATNPSTVLLAQTTDDLDEDREQVRRYLNQYGVRVLPDGIYPQGGLEFADAFRRDLKKSNLFVHLLGPLPSRQPPDLPGSYGQFQYQTAKAAGLPTLLWHRPDFDFTAVTHHDRSLLSEPTVLAMGLEAFKAEIVRSSQPQPAPDNRVKADPFFFINADSTDIKLANALNAEFKRHNCTVAMRASKGSAAAINRDLEDNIVQSDAMILVYGNAEQTWVRSQLRLYNRLKPQRPRPLGALAIYKCPPKPKPTIDMAIPEAREIDCTRQFTLQPVQDIIAEVIR
jgi:hypothetical protein